MCKLHVHAGLLLTSGRSNRSRAVLARPRATASWFTKSKMICWAFTKHERQPFVSKFSER